MKEQEANSFFLLAGFRVNHLVETPNQYMNIHNSVCDMYIEDANNNHAYAIKLINNLKFIIEKPWWLVFTDFGVFKIGWRKRVIEISWRLIDTVIVGEDITKDDVTKSNSYIHAYGNAKAVEYLTRIRLLLDEEDTDETE